MSETHTKQSMVTFSRKNSPRLDRIISRRTSQKHAGLDSLESIISDIKELPTIKWVQREFPNLRGVEEIAEQGLYEYFEHDLNIVLNSLSQYLGFKASYALYAKEENGALLPKSATIVDLPKKGRWVVFGWNPVQIVEFSKNIGEYKFIAEGKDPLDMDLRDFNTFLEWHERKKKEYFVNMGYNIYKGTYTGQIKIVAGKHLLDLPEEIRKSLQTRTSGLNYFYLVEGREHHPVDFTYIMALDEKAASERGWNEMPRDTRKANMAVVTEGHIEIAETFHRTLYGEQYFKSSRDMMNPTEWLDSVIIEPSGDGDFIRISGYTPHFKHSNKMAKIEKLMQMYSFGSMTRVGMHSMDDKTRVKWHEDFLHLIMARHGIINQNQYMRINLQELGAIYKKHIELPLYFEHSGIDNNGNLLLRIIDTPRYDGEKGLYWTTLLDHSGRTLFGQRIFLFDGGDTFRDKTLDVDIIGKNYREFTLKIRKPK